MSSSSANDGSRDALSRQLDELFALAQIVAFSPEKAAELVEETLRRARKKGLRLSAPEPGAAERVRVELYRTLLTLHDDRGARSDLTPGSSDEMGTLKVRLAERYLDAVVPGAFASLPTEQRILLLLCDVQRMSFAESGRVLGLEEETARARLEAAHTALDVAIRSGATGVQQRLLEASLSGKWQRGALQRMSEQEFTAIPPTLRPQLVAGSAEFPSISESRDGAKRKDTASGIGGGLRRAAAVLLVIAIAGLLGYGFSTWTSGSPDVNLISLSVNQAGAIDVAFETASAEQGERFVRDRLGRRIAIPSITGTALRGISIRDVADGAEAPVLLYGGDDDAESIVVYVYSYAFLDTHRNALQLAPDVLGQIESEGRFDLHDLGEARALVWRHSDDIYIAITSGASDTLRARISFPS